MTPVKNYLSQQGYQVQVFDKKNFKPDQFDAIVMTGLDENQLGDDNTTVNAPIIEARGLTPEQVESEIKQRVSTH